MQLSPAGCWLRRLGAGMCEGSPRQAPTLGRFQSGSTSWEESDGGKERLPGQLGGVGIRLGGRWGPHHHRKFWLPRR